MNTKQCGAARQAVSRKSSYLRNRIPCPPAGLPAIPIWKPHQYDIDDILVDRKMPLQQWLDEIKENERRHELALREWRKAVGKFYANLQTKTAA